MNMLLLKLGYIGVKQGVLQVIVDGLMQGRLTTETMVKVTL